MSFTSIHHVGIVVSDLARSLAWYEEKLGFKVRAQTTVPDENLTFAYLRRGDMELELFQKPGAAPVPEAMREVFPSFHFQGIPHLAFGCEDLDATYAWAKEVGLDIALEPSVNTEMDVRFFFINDPDGILIEFVQRLNLKG